MFPQRNTRPSEPISAVKFTSAVRTFAMMFPQTFAVIFPQTFAVILTGRVKLHVCVVFKGFCSDTCGPPSVRSISVKPADFSTDEFCTTRHLGIYSEKARYFCPQKYFVTLQEHQTPLFT